MIFKEHLSPASFLEALKVSIGPTSSLDLPIPRIIGFVDVGGDTYHHISLKNCRGAIQARELETPRQRSAAFGVAEVPLEIMEAILSKLSPPAQKISRKEFDRGMLASGLPNWVVVNLTREAEKSGFLDEF